MGAAAAAVVVAERRIVERFVTVGASSPATARTIGELRVDPRSLGWRRLLKQAVVRETVDGSGRYYIDRDGWQALQRTRRRAAAILVVVLLAIWLYVATMGLLHSAKRAQRQEATPAGQSGAR